MHISLYFFSKMLRILETVTDKRIQTKLQFRLRCAGLLALTSPQRLLPVCSPVIFRLWTLADLGTAACSDSLCDTRPRSIDKATANEIHNYITIAMATKDSQPEITNLKQAVVTVFCICTFELTN